MKLIIGFLGLMVAAQANASDPQFEALQKKFANITSAACQAKLKRATRAEIVQLLGEKDLNIDQAMILKRPWKSVSTVGVILFNRAEEEGTHGMMVFEDLSSCDAAVKSLQVYQE